MAERHRRAVVDVHLRLKPEIGERLKRVAEEERRTLGAQVEVILEYWLARRSESDRVASRRVRATIAE